MQYPQPLLKATFLRREKRFFIYGTDENGRELVAHTNNTGRMTGCLSPAASIWLSPAQNPARKLQWSLELVETANGILVGVNTALANQLVTEAIAAHMLSKLSGFASTRREVKYGSRNSRIDILLNTGDDRVWVEVKNVSLVENRHGRFPDAPSERGRKHLAELMEMVELGDRAALVFCSQRSDADTIGPADDIDPEYGTLLRQAAHCGVEIYAVGCEVTTKGIAVNRKLSIDLS